MRSLFLFAIVAVLLIGGGLLIYLKENTAPDTASFGSPDDGNKTTWTQTLGLQGKQHPLPTKLTDILPYLPTPEIQGNTYIYQDILLDQDGFSKIRRMDIVRNKAGIQSITIDGLQLTGEIKADRKLNIIGFTDKNSVISALLSGIPQITIQNSTLSVLTKHIGGLSFDYDLIGQQTDTQGLVIQGTVESRQKNLKFVSSVEGLIETNGMWHINAALEQGSIDLKTIRVSRGNGQFSFKGDSAPNSPVDVAGSYGLGGLSLYKFPWQNAKGTLRGTVDTPVFNITTTALGQDGIEMDMTIDTTGKDLTIGGDIRITRMNDLIAFIDRHNGPTTDKTDALHTLENTANISLDYGVEGIQSALRDRIVYRVDKPFDGKGTFALSLPE